MKLRVLGCSGGSVKGRFLSSYLFDDTISLDAGSVTSALTLEEQLAVRHVIVSHTHLDHNCGLPFLIDNLFGKLEEPVVVYGTTAVVKSLKQHMFNDELWPDFTKLPSEDKPTLRFEEIHPERSFRVTDLTFTPLEVHHLTPTVGFLIEKQGTAILHTSDTGPTDRVWEVASQHPKLRCVITEVSFSNEDDELARVSGHMTPKILARELEKLTRDVRVLITHTKPSHLSRVKKELKALNLKNVELIEEGKTYTF